MPGLEKVEVAAPSKEVEPEQPRITMSWEEAVHERMVCFAEGVAAGWYAEVAAPSAGSSAQLVTRDSKLDDVAFLDREDLAASLGMPEEVSAALLDKMRVLSEVSHAAVLGAEKSKRATLPLARRWDLFQPVTCFSLEYSGQWKEGLAAFDARPFRGTDEQRQFVRLRRLFAERREAFEAHWMQLSEAAQRDALFRAAPLPLDETDESFPVARVLLPGIAVVNLMGAGLMQLFRQRVSAKFSKVALAELAHAKTIAAQFPEAFVGKLYSLERRRFVSAAKVSPEVAATLLDGRLYSLYLAKMCSVQALLLALLENRDREIELARLSRRKKQTLCDACGVFSAKLLVCSRCKNRKFCSATCQRADWKDHKNKCGAAMPFSFPNPEEE